MEGQTKRQQEEDEEDDGADQCFYNFPEHHNVNSKAFEPVRIRSHSLIYLLHRINPLLFQMDDFKYSSYSYISVIKINKWLCLFKTWLININL